MIAASFFGHRVVENTLSLCNSIENIVIDLIINKGVTVFYFGGFGDFDDVSFQIVTKLKSTYPNIVMVYCLEDERYLRPGKMPAYIKQMNFDDHIYFPLKYGYWYTRIYYRNCEIINNSDYIVFYIRNTHDSGAYKCYKYASRAKKHIISL